MTNDATLLQAFRDGDEAAFARLTDQYQDAVRAACQRQAPLDEVDDCVQAVFLVLARRSTAAARAPILLAWLYQVAHFVCRDAQRAANRRRHTVTSAVQPSAIGHAPEAAVLERLDAALMRLEGRQRAAVLLHASGSTSDAIAQSLGVTTDHARQLLQRGLTALRQRLTRSGAPIGAAMLLAVITTKPASAAHAAPITIGTQGHATANAAALAKGAMTQMTIGTALTWTIAAAFAALISIGGLVAGDLFARSAAPTLQNPVVIEQTPDPIPVPIVQGADPLVLKIKTDNVYTNPEHYNVRVPLNGKPSSGQNQFTLPLNPAYSYNFTIEWGDATSQVVTTTASLTQPPAANDANVDAHVAEMAADIAGPIHTYAVAGTYTVRIHKNVADGFPAIYFNDAGDALKVMELSHWGDVTWSTMRHAFAGCRNMTITAMDAANTQTGGVSDFSYAWYHCLGLTSFPLINTAAGTDFNHTWFACGRLTSFPLINTAAGTDFKYAWNNCGSLTSFPLINTAAGTDFSSAWSYCSGLTSFPLINTAAGTDFSSAWSHCSGLTSFPLINTAAGTNFAVAWYECSGLTSFPLINTAAGTNFDSAWSQCIGLTSFPLINTAAGTIFISAWSGCRSLTSFPLINTAAGTDFGRAWSQCGGLTSFPLINTAAGTDFSGAWSICKGLTSFPLINTAAGTSFFQTWNSCGSLTSFPLINTAAGTNFESTWGNCEGLTGFPLINTAAGTDFGYAWFGCSGLTSFPLINTAAGTRFEGTWGDCRSLTSFPLINTAAGTIFSSAWFDCSGLISFPLINTAAGTDFGYAWFGCSGLTNFPLINTAAGTIFSSAWSGCSGLISFPLINTTAGTSFAGAWSDCRRLNSFPLINTAAGLNFNEAWSGCRRLTSFPTLNMGNMTEGEGCFSRVALSTKSYSDLLIALAIQNTHADVVFDGGLSKCSAAAAAACVTLTGTRKWKITDADNPAKLPKQPESPSPPPPVNVNDF